MTGPAEADALRLLEDALDQPTNEREAWIAAQPVTDRTKERAIALLTTAQPSALRTGGALAGTLLAEPPARIGAYRITGLIGQGGMGAVYRGERIAGDFDHHVAIKLIRPGALSDALKQRFLNERSTLAGLAHPGIARLFDGGETDLGEPYIVMELVDGVSLDRWLETTPSLPARTSLALALCGAVGFAHQNLVVHRDITPSNILVAPDDAPKLIDFGIARPPADPALGDGDARSLAGLSLTPGFAAPERIAGAAATTLGDIYSLGKIIDCLFPEPRDADVVAIIAKAIAAEPQDRYPTTAALAADIAAWRDARPVAARNGGNRYVLSRFVRRNRVAVSATIAAMILLFGAFATIGWLYLRAESARSAEAQRLGEVRSLANYMLFDLNDQLSRVTGNINARVDLAGRAQTYLSSLADTAAGDTALRHEAARGFVALAMAQGVPTVPNLGKPEQARANLARAIALLEGDPLPPASAPDRAEALIALAMVHAHIDADIAKADRGIAAAATALAAVPESARGTRWLLAQRRLRYGQVEVATIDQRPDDLLRFATLLETETALWPQSMQQRREFAMDRAMANYFRGLNSYFKMNLAPALTFLRDAERGLETVDADFPDDPSVLSALMWTRYVAFGAASGLASQTAASERWLARAVIAADRVLALEPLDNGVRSFNANLRQAQSQSYSARGEHARAIAVQRDVIGLYSARLTEERDPILVNRLAGAHAVLANIARASGDRALTCTTYRTAAGLIDELARREKLIGTIATNRTTLRANLARCGRNEPLSAMIDME